MDSNGTRFQLLLGERDWRGGATISYDTEHAASALEYDRAREELTLKALPFVFPTPSVSRGTGSETSTGSAPAGSASLRNRPRGSRRSSGNRAKGPRVHRGGGPAASALPPCHPATRSRRRR
jgi:hypothetical protein